MTSSTANRTDSDEHETSLKIAEKAYGHLESRIIEICEKFRTGNYNGASMLAFQMGAICDIEEVIHKQFKKQGIMIENKTIKNASQKAVQSEKKRILEIIEHFEACFKERLEDALTLKNRKDILTEFGNIEVDIQDLKKEIGDE